MALAARCAPPLAACAPMALAVLAIRWAAPHCGVVAPALQLIAEIGAGALVYGAFAWWLAPAMANDVVDLVRRALRRLS
jgi:hypothetical protein